MLIVNCFFYIANENEIATLFSFISFSVLNMLLLLQFCIRLMTECFHICFRISHKQKEMLY